MERLASNQYSPPSDIVESVTRPFRAVVSKPAQRAYLKALLFSAACFVLLGVSAVAYGIFYYKFVPQIGLERVVHLQFGDGHPFGYAPLGSELASLQGYDVSVALHLPRTPSNLEAGNFMLDLSLLSPSASSFQDNTSTYVLAKSRRPAILTFASPMIDTVSRIWRMPLYVLGWKKEAETLETAMMEGVEFAKGWRNLPGSLRLELQSQERMQVYSATVKFVARFKGLRWVMYNFRILSFLIFSCLFWAVSIVSAVTFWFFLTSYAETGDTTDEVKSEESDGSFGSLGSYGSDGYDGQHSLGDEPSDRSSSDGANPNKPRRRKRRRARKHGSSPRTKKEDDEIKKEEEEIQQSTQIEPLASDTDDDVVY